MGKQAGDQPAPEPHLPSGRSPSSWMSFTANSFIEISKGEPMLYTCHPTWRRISARVPGSSAPHALSKPLENNENVCNGRRRF
jgi:hypothetical protein